MGILLHRFVIKLDGAPERSYVVLAVLRAALRALEIKVIGFDFVGGACSACLFFLSWLQLEVFDNLTVNLVGSDPKDSRPRPHRRNLDSKAADDRRCPAN